MTIKKTMKVKRPTVKAPGDAPAPGASAPASGGAAIADRLRLDAPDPSARGSSSGGKGATVACIAGLIALAVSGILTYILWQHWKFLMPA